MKTCSMGVAVATHPRHVQVDKMDQSKTNLPCVHSMCLGMVWPDKSSRRCPLLRRTTPLMKTGYLLVVGLVASIWSGTPADDLTFTTVWEDHTHGGNMQASLLLMNFHSKCMQTNSVPESLVFSCDNTVKETKNGIVFVFMVWLLCVLQHTRLWRIRTVYKLVGHTHSHCDRAFSRVKVALLGKTYLSEPVAWLKMSPHFCDCLPDVPVSILCLFLAASKDMAKAIMDSMKSYTLRWNHLSGSLNFDRLRSLLGIDCHNLRNIHDLWAFQNRWWHLLPVETIHEWWCVEQTTAPCASRAHRHCGKGCPWTNQTWVWTGGQKQVWRLPEQIWNVSGLYQHAWWERKRRYGMAAESYVSRFWLWIPTPPDDLRDRNGEQWVCHQGFGALCAWDACGHFVRKLPRTFCFCSHCSSSCSCCLWLAGADVPGLPLESLMSVDTAHGADNVAPALEMVCVPMDFVIVKHKHGKLPFVLGQVLDIDYQDESAIVQWWHPDVSKEASMKPGRKKQILDVFGPWMPSDQMVVDALEPLPPSIVKPSLVFLWGFEHEEENKLPFSVLDGIMDEGIDITGLNMSTTNRGNLYRAHRMMRWHGKWLCLRSHLLLHVCITHVELVNLCMMFDVSQPMSWSHSLRRSFDYGLSQREGQDKGQWQQGPQGQEAQEGQKRKGKEEGT